MSSSNKKAQRNTNNLGFNTASSQEESYQEIEKKHATHRCSDGKHSGEREVPVRSFYLNNGGKGLQGACIECQKNRRKNRIVTCRQKFHGLDKPQIINWYRANYADTKKCSKCKTEKDAAEFPTSISMECGLHNQCVTCSIGASQGNGGLRDLIFMPDKDGINYKKKDKCERCDGTDKLAVDHILPIAKGGTDCINNKQTLCVHCNSKKSDTIDCEVSNANLCERYRDPSIQFADKMALSQLLARKVSNFRTMHLVSSSVQELTAALADYKKKNNLGVNLERMLEKIVTLFNK